MGKFLLLLLVGFIAYLFWKKMQGSGQLNTRSAPTGLQIRRPLSEAQQALFIRLQNALPSTMIMVQPALSQLISAQGLHSALEKTLVDFAICRQDSSPLGVVLLDAHNADALEQWITQTGLKCARFKSSSLPDEQKIREAFGFL